MVRVAFLLAFACLADALSVRHRSLPRLAPARRRAAAPLTMSSTERSNKSKLQTIVKDKIEEDTAVKEELNIEEPWRGTGARTRARVSDARSPGHTPTHTI
jgi:hypothetical protein